VGECFFWYRLTRVVPGKGLYNTVVVVVILSELYKTVRGIVPPKLTRRG